jgi:hypothetical protein
VRGGQVAEGIGNVEHEGVEAGIVLHGVVVGKVIEAEAHFHCAVVVVNGNIKARAKIDAEVDAAGVGGGNVFGEHDGAAVGFEVGLIAPVGMRNDLQTNLDGTAVGVLAGTVDVVGVEGERFEVEIAVQVQVRETIEEPGEASADKGEALVFEVAHDLWIAEGLCGVEAAFAIPGSGGGRKRIGGGVHDGLREDGKREEKERQEESAAEREHAISGKWNPWRREKAVKRIVRVRNASKWGKRCKGGAGAIQKVNT